MIFSTALYKIYKDIKTDPNNLIYYTKYGFLYSLVIILPIVLYNYSKKQKNVEVDVPDSVFQNPLFYPVIFMILFSLCVGGVLFYSSNDQVAFKYFQYFTFGIVFFILGYFLYNYINSLTKIFGVIANIIFIVLLFSIAFVGLTIVYELMKQKIRNMKGISGFIINFLFFIPCLIDDLITYLKEQYSITPSVVFILLSIELALIFGYFFFRRYSLKITNPSTSIQLLKDGVFLNKSVNISNNSYLNPITYTDENNKKKTTIRSNYSLSMWIYLNSQERYNEGFTNIFTYGYDTDVKPQIQYNNTYNNYRNNSNLDLYRITFTSPNDTVPNPYYDLEIPSQKWNNFVFNYSDNSVDLFVNGYLERTFVFTDNIPVYRPTDIITIGDNKNINGAICNITYSPIVLTEYEIVNNYNVLVNKNPPINNI